MKHSCRQSELGRKSSLKSLALSRPLQFESLEQRLNLSTVLPTTVNNDQPASTYVVSSQPATSGGWIVLSSPAAGTARLMTLSEILGRSVDLDANSLFYSGIYDGTPDAIQTNSVIGLNFDDTRIALNHGGVRLNSEILIGVDALGDSGVLEPTQSFMKTVPSPSPLAPNEKPDDTFELGGGVILLNDIFESQRPLRDDAPVTENTSWLLDREALRMNPTGLRSPKSLTAAQGRDIAFELASIRLRPQAPSDSTSLGDALTPALRLGEESSEAQVLPENSADTRKTTEPARANEVPEAVDPAPANQEGAANAVPLSSAHVQERPTLEQVAGAQDVPVEAAPLEEEQANQPTQVLEEIDQALSQWQEIQPVSESARAINLGENPRADYFELVVFAGVGLGLTLLMPLRPRRQDQPCDSRRIYQN